MLTLLPGGLWLGKEIKLFRSLFMLGFHLAYLANPWRTAHGIHIFHPIMECRPADPIQEQEGYISILEEIQGMEKGAQLQGREWMVQIGVALAYGLAYCAMRPFSDAHWSLTSGL